MIQWLEEKFFQVILAVVILAAVAWLSFSYGKEVMRVAYEKKAAEQNAYLLKLQQQLEQEQSRIVVRYVDKNRTIDHEDRKYEPSPDACTMLDGHFRVFWDAAADGVQLPTGTRYPDAAPVAVSEVATTIDIAAKRYRQLVAQLQALQAERRSVSHD